MDYTDHIMLVGAGARRFAIEMGFTPQNLLTEKSRQYWLRWKANLNPDDNWLDHKDDVKIAKPERRRRARRSRIRRTGRTSGSTSAACRTPTARST